MSHRVSDALRPDSHRRTDVPERLIGARSSVVAQESSDSPPALPPSSRSRSSSSSSSQTSPTSAVRKFSSSTGLSPPPAYLAHRGATPPSSSRLFNNVQSASAGTLSSSPLSSTGSAQSHRRRQDSVSSSVSGTTDPTSYEESGSECMSTDGGGGGGGSSGSTGEAKETTASPNPKQPPAFSPPSIATTTMSGLGTSRRYGGPSPLSTQDLMSGGAGLVSAGTAGVPTSTISSPPSSSFPIPISATIPPSSVRLSTTPLFPSPLAQASGPVEERHGGDDGDSDIEEEEEDGTDKNQGAQAATQAPEPFGGEFTAVSHDALSQRGAEPRVLYSRTRRDGVFATDGSSRTARDKQPFERNQHDTPPAGSFATATLTGDCSRHEPRAGWQQNCARRTCACTELACQRSVDGLERLE